MFLPKYASASERIRMCGHGSTRFARPNHTLSVLVIGEVRAGIERLRRRDAPAAASLETWLSHVENGYGARILPVSREIADAWGRMAVPDPLPVIDGLLAATAQLHGLTLVTRNTKDVARTAALLNPFE